jgi:hypothetical protein
MTKTLLGALLLCCITSCTPDPEWALVRINLKKCNTPIKKRNTPIIDTTQIPIDTLKTGIDRWEEIEIKVKN